MLYFESLNDASLVIDALNSPVRRKIMQLLYEDGNKNLNDLANFFQLTNSAITLHIKKLERAGLIEIQSMAATRGSQKICKPIHDQLMIDLGPKQANTCQYQDEVPVGYFTNSSIFPTCGIVTQDGVLGEFDDPRYFSFPEHFQAVVLWFGHGFVEYTLPNHLTIGQVPTELQLSFEISSEFPSYKEDYPSDIYFSINGVDLGYWTSPGDFGARRGLLMPDWWPEAINQYGLLKTLIINESGTFIDGSKQISDVTISDLALTHTSSIVFRFAVPENAQNSGGFTIFGKGFGDYNQSIKMKTKYKKGTVN